jgi:DNA/RNA-binding domain of Phe-tRNA-synthetase-like protein
MIANFSGLGYAFEGVGAFLAGSAAVFPMWKHFKQAKEREQRIEDAIVGVASEGGIPARPSVFEQIAGVNTKLTDVTTTVDQIQEVTKQLQPNGGSSLIDKVEQIRVALCEHIAHAETVQADIWAKLGEIEAK